MHLTQGSKGVVCILQQRRHVLLLQKLPLLLQFFLTGVAGDVLQASCHPPQCNDEGFDNVAKLAVVPAFPRAAIQGRGAYAQQQQQQVSMHT